MTMLPVLFSMSKSMSSSPPGTRERFLPEANCRCWQPLQGKGFQELPGDPKGEGFPSRHHAQTTQELMPSHRYVACQAIYLEWGCVGIHSSCTCLATARLGTVPQASFPPNLETQYKMC